jgi:ADP-ribosyl-[dinitrogen reductase] hydrolase
MDKKDRIIGGMWGLLVGDAVGVPYEFNSSEEIRQLPYIDIIPPKGFKRSHNFIAPGTWSDDGAQALCLLDSLLLKGQLDVEDLAERLLRWYEKGYMAVDGIVFDVGTQTYRALSAYKAGVPADKSGFARPDGKGNGSLMRVLPLALWHTGSDENLVKDAHRQSAVTHGHICNQVCCALYCLWARRILQGMKLEEAYVDAVESLRKLYSLKPEYSSVLESEIEPDKKAFGEGSGYVVDCLNSARMIVIGSKSYEEVVKQAIALGDDTDTTAAVAGGLAGIFYGFGTIPRDWVELMKGKEIVEPLVARLINL